jgi:hypothetical protein
VARLLAVLAGLGLLMAPQAGAQSGNPGHAAATATLTVLAGAVHRVPAGRTDPQAASSGLTLAVGDRVLTGPGATALITFLDGTTVTVQPGADVAVARADLAKTGSRIGIRINLGAVWARVVRLVDADSGLTLQSSTATATVHTGLIGGQQDADGTFVCWTQSPGMSVTDATGRRLALQPGQRATFRTGQEPVVAPFRVNRSALRVTATAAVVGVIVGEFVASQKGLGYVIITTQGSMNTPVAFAALAWISVVGLAVYGAVVLAARWIAPWAETTD